MKNLYLFLCLLPYLTAKAQAIQNFGEMEISENGKMGVFNDLINDGQFSKSEGLLGFYGDKPITVLGLNAIEIRDLEIANDYSVTLHTPIRIKNHLNFIFGDFKTQKTLSTRYIDFLGNSDYSGASSFSKVNGYVRSMVTDNFLFPVGDESQLRPISIVVTHPNYIYLSAYQFDNPGYVLGSQMDNAIESISPKEFWTLEGNGDVNMTLSWNERSEINALSSSIEKIHIIGYNGRLSKWVDLGGLNHTGNLQHGFVTSHNFVPKDYSAFTFGRVSEITLTSPELGNKGYHYLVTPNGDAINDRLIIEELMDFEANLLRIYDRNGLLVFELDNYTDEFDGTASKNIPALNRNAGLPEGIYFYLATVNDGELTVQGFLYLDR